MPGDIVENVSLLKGDRGNNILPGQQLIIVATDGDVAFLIEKMNENDKADAEIFFSENRKKLKVIEPEVSWSIIKGLKDEVVRGEGNRKH